jgi:hypothetical protein
MDFPSNPLHVVHVRDLVLLEDFDSHLTDKVRDKETYFLIGVNMDSFFDFTEGALT